MEGIIWINSGLSFSSAVEAGEFLTGQGFAPCNGGFEKHDRLDGGTIYASYVLTLGECFIRISAMVDQVEEAA